MENKTVEHPKIKPYYIYRLRCPISEKTKYIGRTGRPKARSTAHNNLTQGNSNAEKDEWTKMLKSFNLNPIFEIIEIVYAFKESLEREIYWIAHYRKIGDIFNITDGGHGTNGYVPTKENRERASIYVKNRPREEFLDKAIEVNKRPVAQFSVYGDLIEVHEYVAGAAVKLKVHCTTIGMCCRGVVRTSQGYRWAYASKELYEEWLENKEEMKRVLTIGYAGSETTIYTIPIVMNRFKPYGTL